MVICATAGQATWDWKALVYASEKRIRRAALDLVDPLVRERIQRHLDLEGSHPPRNAVEKPRHYFERAYPGLEDRRRYFDEMIADVKPGSGTSASPPSCPSTRWGVVWTTNFDT